MTAVISHGDRPGRLWWTYLSPHFVTPDRAEPCELGTRVPGFARSLVEQVAGRAGRSDLSLYLRGVGRQVALRIPPGFWELLEAVAARIAPRPPRILFLSQEPYVPWELAALERPLDPSLPVFLNCQAAVGRWALGGRRPGLPPPTAAAADAGGLRHALAALGGPPEMIGPALSDGAGVVLAGGPALVPRTVAGCRVGGAPFVFLTGEHDPDAAQALLVAGAGGVAAPLWPVAGEAARELAAEFHRRCLSGEAPAEVLRSLRCAGSAAALAYRLFGHPSAALTRPQPPA
nr:hypothetical protein GCM10020093_006260 [Planobispora longispora]